jgi:hypothetical protein
MSNRWLRFVIAFLAIGAASAAGYRIYKQEQRLAADITAARAADLAAETAIVAISELKAAMHAYVAEGQGDAFWTARAAALIDRVRASVLELDATATAAGTSLTETLDLTDRLAAAEQRAREHVRSGQRLLAGEVIFTDARDLLDGMRLQLSRARTAVAEASSRLQASIRREQALLTLGAAGILAFATLLLVIPGTSSAVTTTAAPTPASGVGELESTARVISRTATPASPGVTTAKPQGTAARPASGVRTASAGPARDVQTASSSASPTRTGLHEEAPFPAVSLREAAAVCTDLGRASQSIEIAALLQRAANVLNATGTVVWMSAPDGREMYPAASAGYDERLLARIGAIQRDANNVTAAALRDASARTSPRGSQSAAALAVPLLTPLGPVGVFSAEIREVATIDETRLAVATIFAAQLATLLGSMTSPAEAPATEPSQPAKAQA